MYHRIPSINPYTKNVVVPRHGGDGSKTKGTKKTEILRLQTWKERKGIRMDEHQFERQSLFLGTKEMVARGQERVTNELPLTNRTGPPEKVIQEAERLRSVPGLTPISSFCFGLS